MKKLLLASLLLVGATSFGAAAGEITQEGTGMANLPVVVKGNVLEDTKLVLVVTPEKNAGVNGDTMEFDFGNIGLGSKAKHEMTNGFKVELLKKEKQIAFNQAPTAKLTGVGVDSKNETVAADVIYTLSSALNKTEGEAYRGTLTVKVEPKKAGSFIDTACNIQVSVAGQTNGINE